MYLIPREIDSDPFRLRGVWHPQMRGPVLAGELGRDLRAILPGLGGGEDTHRPRGEGITASGGRASTWAANNTVVVVFVRGRCSFRDEDRR